MKRSLLFLSLFLGLFVLTTQTSWAQAVTGVTLNKHSLALDRWDGEQLIATISPADAANTNVVWHSSNDGIIHVDNTGNVTAYSDGIATVYVKTEDGGFADSCVVTCRVDDAANIVEFSFAGEVNAARINVDTRNVEGFMPYGTDVTNMTVVGYQISPGATITPLPESVHDFSDTVSFVITAPDGKTQQTWKVFLMVLPDMGGAQHVHLDFKTAPQGWISDTVSWEDDNFRYLLDYPSPADTSWHPSADIGSDGFALFPARLHIYLKDTSKVINSAFMYIEENCDDSCTYVQFLGDNNTDREYIDKMTRKYHFFDVSSVKAYQVDFASFEGAFSDITFWIANKDGSVNHPPVANAGPDQTVYSKDTVQLDGSASLDPDQQPLHYQWSAPSSIVLDDPTLAMPSFIAPNSMDTLHLTFTLSVSDGSLSSTDQVIITVIPTNHIPVADAGADQTVMEGDSVYFDGTGSHDADGDSLRYIWLAPGGIHLTDSTSPTPAFLAPEVQQTTVFSFALIVNDGLVNSLHDTVFITVTNKNHRPVAWIDLDHIQVNEGDSSIVEGHYSYDPDGDSLSFHWWAQPGSGIGFVDSNAMDPRFGAPMVDHDTTFEVYVKVSDGQLLSEPDTAYIHVMNVNAIPVAVLQKHTTPVFDGDTVYLDGSGSYDPDGDSLIYKWTASKGIWLSGSGATNWFIAPIVQKETPYFVTLTVNDGSSDSSPDTDTIWVKHKNHVPVAEAGYPIEMSEGDSSYLYGSLSYDMDGDSLRYSWKVPTGFWIADSTQADSRFSAPQVAHDTNFSLILKVYDGQVWSAPDTCRVTVKKINHAPVAKIVSTAQIFYGVSMNEGDTLWIDGSLSYDPDGDSITYDWALPKAFVFYYYDSVKVMVVAPMVTKTTSFDAALFVKDHPGELRSRDNFIIQVLNVNQAPVADAGKSFATLSGQTEELDASGSSDADGDSLRITWIPPAGITLSDVHTVSPTFQAPEVTSDQVFTFKLVVSDGKLLSDTAEVNVTVKPIAATLSVTATLNEDTISYRQRHITLYWQDTFGRWIMENILSYNDNGETYYAIWEGSWMITVDPVGDSAGFVSTFSGDVTCWADGNAISITAGTETHVNIHCVPEADNLTGDGMIDGYIQRDTTTSDVPRSTIAHVDGNLSGDVPAVGVTIYLYRSSDSLLLTSTLTDEDGLYQFKNLPFDVYYLLIQLPGYDPNTPWPVEVTENDTVAHDVNFLISVGTQEITDVNNPQEINVKLYPNPVKDMLYVQSNDQQKGDVVRVYDLTGHLVITEKIENNITKLDVSGLRKGFYLLRIENNGKMVTRKFIRK